MTKEETFRKLTATDDVRGSLRTKSAHAALSTGVTSFADFAIRIGSTAVLARLVTPEHFGIVMMVTAVIAIADQLKEMGLSAATIQRTHITHHEVSNLFWLNLALGAFIAVLLCASSPLISGYYREPRLLAITCLLASTFLFGGLAVQHQALLSRTLRLGRTSAVRLTASILSTGLAILLAWLDFGYWALIWREVARSAFMAVGMWLSFPWIPSLPSQRADVRPLLHFGANITGANILGALTSGVDRFFLGRQWGAPAVGVYRQAYQLIAAPTDQLLSPLYQVAQPALSLLQSDGPRFLKFYQTLLTLVAAVTMPLSVFVAVYSIDLTLLLLGANWIDCAPLIMLLSLATFARQSIGSTALILITRGHSNMHLRLSAGHNVAIFLGVVIGVQWGVTGLAIADVAVTYLTAAPRLYFSLKESPVSLRDILAGCARPALASFVMGIVLYFVAMQTNMARPAFSLGVGASLAPLLFLGAWSLLPGGRSELTNIIRNLRTSIIRKDLSVAAPKALSAH